eukprot:CAMPEP_0178441816 /NCGR_PEP_ID=MMETSP0689_2-20121128/37732_1 /TAXON_ID=160604 /ORGANISM="Amphidinium massartii, Strain CS-259" /LENGTH=174 /DNA_ID=CAMNT_0020065119 /DNA_START=637 /DNA_END=1162 /DNA_ORIENTATION=-
MELFANCAAARAPSPSEPWGTMSSCETLRGKVASTSLRIPALDHECNSTCRSSAGRDDSCCNQESDSCRSSNDFGQRKIAKLRSRNSRSNLSCPSLVSRSSKVSAGRLARLRCRHLSSGKDLRLLTALHGSRMLPPAATAEAMTLKLGASKIASRTALTDDLLAAATTVAPSWL